MVEVTASVATQGEIEVRNSFKIRIFLIADLCWSAACALFSLSVETGSATTVASVNAMKRACGKSPTALLRLGVLLEPGLGKHGCETLTCSSMQNSEVGHGWEG